MLDYVLDSDENNIDTDITLFWIIDTQIRDYI
jgi:hypothetical protein